MQTPPAHSPIAQRGRRRSEQSRNAILMAAADLVENKGYAATTMEAIAKQAGAGKMTLYRWWPSKASLFAEVYENLVTPASLDQDCGTLRKDLHHLLHTLFTLYRETPAAKIMAGLIADAQDDADARKNLQGQLVIGRRSLLTAPLERAVGRGEFKASTDCSFIAELVVGAIWHRLLMNPENLNADFESALINMILKLGEHE